MLGTPLQTSLDVRCRLPSSGAEGTGAFRTWSLVEKRLSQSSDGHASITNRSWLIAGSLDAESWTEIWRTRLYRHIANPCGGRISSILDRAYSPLVVRDRIPSPSGWAVMWPRRWR